ncbi:unnamed protein product [Fructobacillus fructosus]|uniref:Phage protein n=1 Tax=Fructobacillus fructosus TaxID=1631 RepID=A0ABN9YWS6_9LACO|nr:unnamed protein product [Fructobacillus fructosus]
MENKKLNNYLIIENGNIFTVVQSHNWHYALSTYFAHKNENGFKRYEGSIECRKIEVI